MKTYEQSLIDRGLARLYRGRVIPVMKGGDGQDELFAPLPVGDDGALDLSGLTAEALSELVESYDATIKDIAGNPVSFITDDLDANGLVTATRAAVEGLEALRAELASRDTTPALSVEDLQSQLSDLAARATLSADDEAAADDGEAANEGDAAGPDGLDGATEDTETAEVEEAPDAEAAVVAAGMPKPAAARAIKPRASNPTERLVALVAGGGVNGRDLGQAFRDEFDIAQAMIDRRGMFGDTAEGNSGEKYSIARASWRDQYGAERTLGRDEIRNRSLVAAVVNDVTIKKEMNRRKKLMQEGVLVASGGLCAPVTPYYNLQYISVPDRPVMAALPSFNADRGGLRYARPAALSAVSTAIGIRTAAQDGLGGSNATKTCQVIPCPPFQETDVDIIYHCLQFGNLGARAFPELVAQWNNLVLAAHARLAESNLLTGIDGFSTAVTAGALGLGASATLFSQILAAANGMRNRNRMDPEAVLRLLIPDWAIDLIISDVIRTQFERFDTDEAKVVALLRSFDIEPAFYIDGPNGKAQVFGAQTAGALLPFPPTVNWFLFPEGTFIFLDGGTLELGIVRDSVLNSTNDFQIFGETFENVAFVGVEALSVVSTTCDSGTVTLPHATTCPITY